MSPMETPIGEGRPGLGRGFRPRGAGQGPPSLSRARSGVDLSVRVSVLILSHSLGTDLNGESLWIMEGLPWIRNVADL
jgi:hypothetical protein